MYIVPYECVILVVYSPHSNEFLLILCYGTWTRSQTLPKALKGAQTDLFNQILANLHGHKLNIMLVYRPYGLSHWLMHHTQLASLPFTLLATQALRYW